MVHLMLTTRVFYCILIVGAVLLSLLYPYPYCRIIIEVHFGYKSFNWPRLVTKAQGRDN